MYLLVLLAGFYLGGLVSGFFQIWFRNDEADAHTWISAFAWPVGALVMLVLGREEARMALGILSNEQIEELLAENDVLRDRIAARMAHSDAQRRENDALRERLEVRALREELVGDKGERRE